MRLIFAGTPEPAVVALEKLLESEHEVVAVITRPDARRGRGRTLHPSPVAAVAQERGLEVLKPTSLAAGSDDGEAVAGRIRELAPDAIPVVAYGNLIPDHLLDVPRHGWVNLHFSLLPRWRGAAPVQAAIAAGDESTGATIFRIDAGLDTGDVLGTVGEVIRPDDTADDLLTRLAYSGGDLLVETMTGLAAGSITPQPQPAEGTHAPKITTEDARVDWTRSAVEIDRQVRAVTPAPGAWSLLAGERFKLGPVRPAESSGLAPGELGISKLEVRIGTGDGDVVATQVQPMGKKMMNAADWARGVADTEGLVLQ